MLKNNFSLKTITFILIHSFLLFDASWAGGLHIPSTGSGTCLNAPLRIADKSLSTALMKMIHSEQTAVLGQDALIPFEMAPSQGGGGVRQSAKVVVEIIATQLYGLIKAVRAFANDDNVINAAINHADKNLEYYLIGLGFVIVVVAIIYIEKINDDSRREEKEKHFRIKFRRDQRLNNA